MDSNLKKYEYFRNDNGVLYCGDCLEILPMLPKVDLVLTDPPYGINASKGTWGSTNKCKVTDYGKSSWDLIPASKDQIKSCIDSGINSIIWGGNYFDVIPSRCWLVWDKLNTGNFADCEIAWTNLSMSIRIFRHRWNGMIRDSWKGIPRVHPTQKPVPLFIWCISFTEALTIIDPFLGSGTTAVACERLKRKWIGIEISEEYCEVAKKRIERETKQLKMF